ncbi:MAG: Maf family protein [Ferruginibacter sp.]
MVNKIILASQSPRRKQLLEWAEIDFDIMGSDSDESFPHGLTFEEVAIFIARNKAKAVLIKTQTTIPVLAADTIVVCDKEILGKPTDREDAIRILRKLSGKEHQVITGVVILFNGKEISFADKTNVNFNTLTDQQIVFYVDNYKPYDKAGAYAIQEWIGVIGIKYINGDFYNVMGLPVSRVVRELSLL